MPPQKPSSRTPRPGSHAHAGSGAPPGAGGAGAPSPSPLRTLLAPLRLGPPAVHRGLTLWPLRLPRPEEAPAPPAPPPSLLLGEALASGDAVLTEASASGRVGRVRLENRSAEAVVVLFGELLRGAKQDRTATASFRVPAFAAAELDVACVEEGRWDPCGVAAHAGLWRFARSEALLPQALRRGLERRVAEARGRHGRFVADQDALWGVVGARLAREGVAAPTGSVAALRRHHAGALAAARRAFVPQPEQVGFVAAIGSAVVGLEVLGRPEEFAAALPSLVEAYVLDALAAPGPHGAAGGLAGVRPPAPPRPDAALAPGRFEAPEPFLSALQTAPGDAVPSLGEGQDWRFASRSVRACALVLGDAVVHASGFPAAERD